MDKVYLVQTKMASGHDYVLISQVCFHWLKLNRRTAAGDGVNQFSKEVLKEN